jgi:murein DD-endopeptidase MepM/ murein hydrolase activator NlpD
VLATDGYVHLAYELVLTNVTPRKLRIDSLQVRDARTHRVLLTLAGNALAGELSPIGGPEAVEDRVQAGDPPQSSQTTVMASSATVVVWLDVRVRHAAEVPAVLDHRLVVSFLPQSTGAPSSHSEVVARTDTVRQAPVVLGPPVGPGIWYASEGCCADDTHHRRGLAPINGQLLVPQRFAIDWFALNTRHETWVGDPHDLDSYLTYRLPALAAANGTVVDVQDGLGNNPDLPKPPPIPPIEDTVGNHVVVKVAPGVFLLYAHFDPGSVRVHVGERVHRGQTLGLIGTSGNSTTPHLHFQVMTSPTFFPTDSPPFVFDRFTLLGQVTDRIWDDNLGLQPTGRLPYASARPRTVRRLQMPLDRNVIAFGGVPQFAG